MYRRAIDGTHAWRVNWCEEDSDVLCVIAVKERLIYLVNSELNAPVFSYCT